MGKIANRMLAFLDKVETSLNEHLRQFAEDVEEYTRATAHWMDDTGSARAAITGYLVDVDDYRKNFGAVEWQAAQAGKVKSRYGHKAENYRPLTQEHPTPTDDKVVILTTFVRYGEKLEFMPQTAGTFHGAMEASREDFREAVQKAIAEAVARA